MGNTTPKRTPDRVSLSTGDLVARVFKRIDYSEKAVFSIVFVHNVIRNLALGAYYDVLLPSGKSIGLTRDIATWLFDLLVQPTLFAYYAWIQKSCTSMFLELTKRNVVQSNDHFDQELRLAETRMRHPAPQVIASLIGLLVGIAFAVSGTRLPQSTSSPWIVGASWLPWLVGAFIGLGSYTLAMTAYQLTIAFITLDRVFASADYRFQPFHPDGVGGLGAIGRFLAILASGFAAIGAALTAAILQGNYNAPEFLLVVFGVALYIGYLAFFFIYPAARIDHHMRRRKNQICIRLSNLIDADLSQLQLQSADVSDVTDRLDRLIQIRNHAENFRTWPISLKNMRRVLYAIISSLVPLLLTALPIVFEAIKPNLIKSFQSLLQLP